jgi:hypothetical protein
MRKTQKTCAFFFTILQIFPEIAEFGVRTDVWAQKKTAKIALVWRALGPAERASPLFFRADEMVQNCHCERSEAISILRFEIAASLRSSQ